MRPVGGLAVGGAGARGPGAILGDVADSVLRTADCRGQLETVRRTRRTCSCAGLSDVAGSVLRAADDAGVAGRVLAGGAGPVTLVKRADVPVVGAGTPARPPPVGRAGGARSRAGLGDVALSILCAADNARVAGRALTGGPSPRAPGERADVPVVGSSSSARPSSVGRAGRGRSRTGLGDVALSVLRAADGACVEIGR